MNAFGLAHAFQAVANLRLHRINAFGLAQHAKMPVAFDGVNAKSYEKTQAQTLNGTLHLRETETMPKNP